MTAITLNSPRLDERMHGDVQCASLVRGENSKIEGDVAAEDVVIRGRLIAHGSLAMEQGAYFEGKWRRAEDPLAVESPASEKPTAVERGPADSAREITSKGFIRSLNGSNNADDHID